MTNRDRKNTDADERAADRSPLGRDDRDVGRTGGAPAPREEWGVLSNAVQRTDNSFNGIENDESLIGVDIVDDEDENLDEIDRIEAARRSPGGSPGDPDR